MNSSTSLKLMHADEQDMYDVHERGAHVGIFYAIVSPLLLNVKYV
jgi:hypothetical protein